MTPLRVAGAIDLDAIMALEAGAGFTHPWSRAAWGDEVAAHWVAVADAVAVVAVAVAGDTADLNRIIVAPAEQRRGLGRELLAAAIDVGRSAGAVHMLLEVAADNAAAIGLYTRAGFTEIHRRRDYYGPGEDAVIMRRSLGDC